jgi:hypothetical protein
MIRNIIAITAGLIFIHHVICTVLYNAPDNPLTNSFGKYVSGYMEPFFTQKWLLFAPEPATNDLKLWYRMKRGETWTTWCDPLEPVLKKHHNARYTYNAKLLYVYGNIPRDLGIKNEELSIRHACAQDDLKCAQMKNKSLLASSEFKLAKRYVKEDILKSFPNIKIDSIQIMIIQLYPRQFSERLSNKPFGHANASEFIPIPFEDHKY